MSHGPEMSRRRFAIRSVAWLQRTLDNLEYEHSTALRPRLHIPRRIPPRQFRHGDRDSLLRRQ